MAIIEVNELTKKYDSFTAVDNISLLIKEGSIFGFLGHNGAGKTTTIKVLTGQLSYSSGSVNLFGLDISRDTKAVHEKIGIVSEEQSLYKNLTVFQNIDFYRKIYNLPPAKTLEIIERLDLLEKKDVKAFQLSKGLKQRTLLARSILHSPKVLFLDEPTSGLDPHSAQSILALIKEMKAAGTTIFLTTHYMEEAEELCDQVTFISKGKIIKNGSPMKLINEFSSDELEVTYQDGDQVTKKTLKLSDADVFNKIEDIKTKFKIFSIHTKDKTLKDIFIQLTKDEKNNEN